MKKFEHEIQDEGENVIALALEPGQSGGVEVEQGVAVLYLNRAAARFLARLFAQIAEGRYTSGFHVHLGENYDPDAAESLRVVLESES